MALASRLGILASLTVALCGCVPSPSTIDAAYGPSPILNHESVKQSSYNYIKTRDALVGRAGYAGLDTAKWYEVTRAGFDYVDEQCDAYLAALYRLRRDRDSTKSQIQSFGNTTTAILGFTEALPKTILITAAAFGLAAQATDNASSALLFAMDPSDIQSLVKSQTDAYRAGAAAQQTNYTTSNAAMEGVRGYLKLCLPVSIEAQVKAALQGTLYVARTTSFGVPALNRVQTASPNAVGIAPTNKDLLTQPIYVPKPPPPDTLSVGLTTEDVPVRKSEMAELQSKLCVTSDGNIGGKDSDTRKALGEVQSYRNWPRTGKLDRSTHGEVSGMSKCSPDIHRHIFEHLHLTSKAAVTTLRTRLSNFVKAHSTVLPKEAADIVGRADFDKTDNLNADDRKVISAIQKMSGDPETGKYDGKVFDKID